METVYDWITVLGFAGLVTLFLQRSSLENPPDTIWHYLPPAIGAAVTNYFGNEGNHVVAIAVGIASIAYVILVLKPRIKA
ncbi:MAG: XrtV sorting system accessory protein [Sphingomonadaceae bacterium]